MKNINQLFKNNTSLMYEPEVQEQSCNDTLKDDELAERFKETPRVDFKETITNLKKYMLEMCRLYKLEL